MKFLLSRTDNLGDVVLTLPMAGVLKHKFPGCKVMFLGKAYTKPIIEKSVFVDEFIDWDELSAIKKTSQRIDAFRALKIDFIFHVYPDKKVVLLSWQADVPFRVATANRWFSWLFCNDVIYFSRRRSSLHEAQLNMILLRSMDYYKIPTPTAIAGYYGLFKLPTVFPPKPSEIFHLILHPKSKGSAREWGLDNFSRLIDLLPVARYRISITGTEEEGNMMREFLDKHKDRVEDMTGRHTVEDLVNFINSADGLVAASTGPLHIAAALGKRAIGIYAPMRPIFPKRWAPIGYKADYLVLDKNCNDCRKTCDCTCIRAIRPEQVVEKLAVC